MNGELLDTGCGIGTLIKKISVQTDLKNISGCDFSREAVEASQKLGFNIFQADLTDIETFDETRYNSIICSEVLEHIYEDDVAISNLNKLLLKEGKIIITVPYSMKYWSSHDEFSGHVRRYDYDELMSKIRRANFIILDAFVWGYPFFSTYYRLLTKVPPGELMQDGNNRSSKFKKYISRALYYIFYLDDLFTFTKKGRRLFLIAEKK